MKVLICDDHSIIRNSLKEVFKPKIKNLELFEATNGEELDAYLKKHQFDMISLDVIMPSFEPITFLEYVQNLNPCPKVFFFSMCSEDVFAERFIKLGAKGFISKTSTLDQLSNAIDVIINGGIYASPKVFNTLLSARKNLDNNPISNLSDRELEIMLLLVKGYSTNQIAEEIHIQPSTVATYKKRMYEKLNVSNVIELFQLSHVHRII